MPSACLKLSDAHDDFHKMALSQCTYQRMSVLTISSVLSGMYYS